MKAARGVQAINTAWALAEEAEVSFVPAAFKRGTIEFYGLKGRSPYIRPLSRCLGPFNSQLFFLWRALPLVRACEIVFTRHLKTAWWLCKLKALHHRPVVYEAHEIFAQKGEKLSREREVFFRSSGLVFISKGLRQAVERKFAPPSHVPRTVIPSGTKLISVDLVKHHRPVQEIVYLGTFRYPWKGEDLLLEVASRLPPNLRLKIYGDPPSRNHPGVVYAGYVVPGQIGRVLCQAQIAIFPISSRQEIARHYTSPMKLLDYMAAGCAIVASDLPSVREIVSEKEALLVPPDDPEAFVAGIQKLASGQRLRFSLAQAAHRRARDFTWEKRAQKLYNFLQEVVS